MTTASNIVIELQFFTKMITAPFFWLLTAVIWVLPSFVVCLATWQWVSYQPLWSLTWFSKTPLSFIFLFLLPTFTLVFIQRYVPVKDKAYRAALRFRFPRNYGGQQRIQFIATRGKTAPELGAYYWCARYKGFHGKNEEEGGLQGVGSEGIAVHFW